MGGLETQSQNQGGVPFPPREQRQPLPLIFNNIVHCTAHGNTMLEGTTGKLMNDIYKKIPPFITELHS